MDLGFISSVDIVKENFGRAYLDQLYNGHKSFSGFSDFE
jgi:hypothetical protein